MIVSSAIAPDNPEVSRARVKKKRAELLAELVELRPSIVVAGAHGKTTTTAMIAFVLDRLGLDPAFLIGGEIPQLDGNARAGEGWLVAEGDESDRSLELLRPRIAVLTNVELDHHATFASESGGARAVRGLARAGRPRPCAARSSSRSRSSWRFPESTTAATRPRRWRRWSSPA